MVNHQNVTFRHHSVIYKISSLVMACALILSTRSIWLSTSTGAKFGNFVFITFVLSGGILILNVKSINKKFIIKYFKSYIFITIFMIIYMLLPNNISHILSIFTLYICLTIIYFYFCLYSQDTDLPLMLKYYINSMCIIGIISLFFWSFGSVLHVLKPTGTIISYWANENGIACNSYYGIYFETQSLAPNMIRNSAIFSEAPMSAVNFLLALALQNLYNTDGKMHKLKEVILILSVLSTTSTTGYIGFLIIYILKYLLSALNQKNLLRIIVFTLLGIVGLIIIHVLFTQKLGGISGEVRLDDYRAGVKAWRLSPIFGSGYDSTLFQTFMSNWRSNNLGFSNTIMNILVDGGIYLLIPYVYVLCKAVYNTIKSRNESTFIFSILVAFLFMTTLLINTYILLFMFVFVYIYSGYEQ